MQRLAAAVSVYPTDSRFRLLRLAAVRELAGRGEAPEGAVALVDEDGRELRLVSGGTAGDFARIGLVTGQAYLALGRFDTAEQQFKLAREETSFRAQADRALEAVQKGRRGSTPRVRPLPQPK